MERAEKGKQHPIQRTPDPFISLLRCPSLFLSQAQVDIASQYLIFSRLQGRSNLVCSAWWASEAGREVRSKGKLEFWPADLKTQVHKDFGYNIL